MGPRLESRGNIEPGAEAPGSRRLQWGRDLRVAEMDQHFSCARLSADASMGPRLESRGNTRQYSTVYIEIPKLQWGRDLRVAEISLFIRLILGRLDRFNGAAT